MTVGTLERVDFPIISDTRQEIEKVEKQKAEILARRTRRMDFWMDMMDDNNEKTADRLRASELAGKADGDFIERREIGVNINYREMLVTQAGKLEELEPMREVTLLEGDFVEEATEDVDYGDYEIS